MRFNAVPLDKFPAVALRLRLRDTRQNHHRNGRKIDHGMDHESWPDRSAAPEDFTRHQADNEGCVKHNVEAMKDCKNQRAANNAHKRALAQQSTGDDTAEQELFAQRSQKRKEAGRQYRGP